MKKIKDICIGIVSSAFRADIVHEFEKRCIERLKTRGVAEEHITIVRVPGAFEIPLAADLIARRGIYDALIAFGAVVKGETYHFEQISNECARGCAEVSRARGIPVIFEVWSVYKAEDALLRATREKENKGVEAAEAALAMIEVVSNIRA